MFVVPILSVFLFQSNPVIDYLLSWSLLFDIFRDSRIISGRILFLLFVCSNFIFVASYSFLILKKLYNFNFTWSLIKLLSGQNLRGVVTSKMKKFWEYYTIRRSYMIFVAKRYFLCRYYFLIAIGNVPLQNCLYLLLTTIKLHLSNVGVCSMENQ